MSHGTGTTGRLKVVLVTLVTLTVVFGGTALAIHLLFASHRNEWAMAVKQMNAEGRDQARGGTWNDCVDLTLMRLDECSGGFLGSHECRITREAFLLGCLDAASPVDGFCDGVPPRDDIARVVDYALAICAAADRKDDVLCGKVLGAISRFCADLQTSAST